MGGCLMPVQALPPIPSALEGAWGQGELSPRGAAVDGLIHSWGKEEKKLSYVTGWGWGILETH